MSQKAIFLDRDGTINVDFGYVHKISDFVFLDGAIEALQILQEAGYQLIIISNQSGIARGIFTMDELNVLNNYMISYLNKSNVHISNVYYCPHISHCNCRKPKLGLFYKAAKENDVQMPSSYAIGDNLRDLEICKNGIVHGFLITNKILEVSHLSSCISLLDAAQKIANIRQFNTSQI